MLQPRVPRFDPSAVPDHDLARRLNMVDDFVAVSVYFLAHLPASPSTVHCEAAHSLCATVLFLHSCAPTFFTIVPAFRDSCVADSPSHNPASVNAAPASSGVNFPRLLMEMTRGFCPFREQLHRPPFRDNLRPFPNTIQPGDIVGPLCVGANGISEARSTGELDRCLLLILTRN
jgi:hypothetical protein